MTSQNATPKRENRGRLRHDIPMALIDEIHDKCDRHLPTPERRVFLELIITMGLDAYGEEKNPTAPFVGRAKNPRKKIKVSRFEHFLDVNVVNRFNETHQKHQPPAMVRGFLELILNLGVQAYEREYTIYGFKKG